MSLVSFISLSSFPVNFRISFSTVFFPLLRVFRFVESSSFDELKGILVVSSFPLRVRQNSIVFVVFRPPQSLISYRVFLLAFSGAALAACSRQELPPADDAITDHSDSMNSTVASQLPCSFRSKTRFSRSRSISSFQISPSISELISSRIKRSMTSGRRASSSHDSSP